MTGASGGGDQYPGRRPETGEELLADVMLGDAPKGYVTLGEELTTALGGITTRGSGLGPQEEWVPDAPGLKTDQAEKIVKGHGARLQDVVGYVFGDEEGRLGGLPPAEELEQVVKLDGLIKMAAGQPVVILKPGKSWIDIGLLERRRRHDDNTGLQRSELRDMTSSIVLPVHNTVTVDIRSGREPEPEDQQYDDELQARTLRRIDTQGEETTRPVIDPLHTRVLLTAEDARSVPDDQTTAYVLIGYTQLQRTLNRILGFDMGRTDDQDEAVPRFYTALQIQRRLEETAEITFDLDFVDGYLASRIDMLEQEMREGGPLRKMSSDYQETELAEMQGKLARLTDEGWIAKPPAA